MKFLKFISALLFSWGLTNFILGSMLLITAFYHFSRDLPDYGTLAEYNPSGMTRVYAASGKLMGEYAQEKRIFMPLVDMPRRVVNAFVAAEDKTFYHNQGIDPYGVARAVIENVKNLVRSNKSLVGGSTITQQVVKNMLLTSEKTFNRKIKEAILALRITTAYSKDKIMEIYLNEIYLGMGAYGVASAAQRYFDKTLDELTTEELALLAAMPKSPVGLDPRRNYDGAIARRNYVLDRMREDGYINVSEAERAKTADIKLGSRDDIETVRGGYFAEEVRRSLINSFGEDSVNKGGLYVKTTMNTKMQRQAERALRDALLSYDKRHGYRGPLERVPLTKDSNWQSELIELSKDVPVFDQQEVAIVLSVGKNSASIGRIDGSKGTIPFSGMSWAAKVNKVGIVGNAPKRATDVLKKGDVILTTPYSTDGKSSKRRLIQIPEVNGGLVAMEPHTGRVLAMSGGYNSFEHFNRATQAKRQPGSCFKPFVYLAALERGFTPSTIIVDEPISVSQGPGKPLWTPKNYGGDFIGPATMRVGLERSRNIMTVKIAQMLDIERIVRIGKRFDIYDNPPGNYSMVLGANETTLLKLVTGYAMIANGGVKVASTLIDRVDDHNGKLLYKADKRICPNCVASRKIHNVALTSPPQARDTRERVLDPRVAYQMTSILEGVVQRGTAQGAKVLGFPVAGKTGTTNDSRDAWFMGYTQDLVVGVYIGFDKPKSLGRKETGGKVALPAFVNFMKMVYEDRPKTDFRVPAGITKVKVDRYTGTPPLPWMQGGQLITESFLEGGSIFVPEGEDNGLEMVDLPEVAPDYYADFYDENAGSYAPSMEDDPRGYVQQRIRERRALENQGYSTQDLGNRPADLNAPPPASGFVYGDERDERWKPIEAPVKQVPRKERSRRTFEYESQGRTPDYSPEVDGTGTGGLF